MTLGAMTLSIMILGDMTLSITALDIRTLSIMTLGAKTLSLMTLCASHHLAVASQTGAKDQFCCTVDYITLNSNCEAHRVSKN